MSMSSIDRAWGSSAAQPDGLDAFGSEAPIPPGDGGSSTGAQSPERSTSGGLGRAVLKWTGIVLIGAAVGVAGVVSSRRVAAAAPLSPVSLTVETTPPGVALVIDGHAYGTTPVHASLAAGTHHVQIGGTAPRAFSVDLAAGTSLTERLELSTPSAASAPAAPEGPGSIHVQSEPSNLPVFVDGTWRGVSPLSLESLAAGRHDIAVRVDSRLVRRTVDVRDGQTALVLISLEPPRLAPGWLHITSAVPLQLLEDGKVIGTTDVDRLMLAPGLRHLQLVNRTLGYSAEQDVQIDPGEMTALTLDTPNGTISINATPWADVWIDGESVGQTPIGQLSRPIGAHEVVFRNPQFDEHKTTVIVTAQDVARVAVDLTKQ